MINWDEGAELPDGLMSLTAAVVASHRSAPLSAVARSRKVRLHAWQCSADGSLTERSRTATSQAARAHRADARPRASSPS
jgi:hypothetical protein